jgi:hypothetical protein
MRELGFQQKQDESPRVFGNRSPNIREGYELNWITIMKRAISIFFLVVGCAAVSWGGEEKTAAVPVLVELFTAEGCSSCPPADAWLLQLDKAQPLAGAQLIVLSEHVDYWDHDGWKDPYSSSLVTARQADYARGFRIDSPYTPQVVVNGTVNLKLSDSQQVRQTFEQAAKASTLPVTITSVAIDPGKQAILRAQVEVDGRSAERSADIYEAVALDHAESQVLRGENGGKRLMHVAVVQQFAKIGKIEKGKTFSRAIELKLKPGTDPKNTRLIIFVQEAGPGKVLGAALQDPIS